MADILSCEFVCEFVILPTSQRKRYYFTNSCNASEREEEQPPWGKPWLAVHQVTLLTRHKLLPVVRQQGYDKERGIAKRFSPCFPPLLSPLPCSHLATYLQRVANAEGLLQAEFWKRHLSPEYSGLYCAYLALEVKHGRNQAENKILDRLTLDLSLLFRNPCAQLPVRPLSAEEALALTGIAKHVSARQDLTPYTTQSLCQSFAGNSFHPKLILATLGGEQGIRAFVAESNKALSTDGNSVAPPQQVEEHFATVLLGMLLQNSEKRQALQKVWGIPDSTLPAIKAYRHLREHNDLAGGKSEVPLQLGIPDDRILQYRQASLLQKRKPTGDLSQASGMLTYTTILLKKLQGLLVALRTTRFSIANGEEWVRKLLGTSYARMLQKLPRLQTSLVTVLQWWAGQAPTQVNVSPAQTTILIHVPTVGAPVLFQVGAKRPCQAFYIQQYPNQAPILVGITAHKVGLQRAVKMNLVVRSLPPFRGWHTSRRLNCSVRRHIQYKEASSCTRVSSPGTQLTGIIRSLCMHPQAAFVVTFKAMRVRCERENCSVTMMKGTSAGTLREHL